jgi:hypothetical protein
MNTLREENTHLLAGALIHEGMHALVSDRATENILVLWNEWADCTIEEPLHPPSKETKELIDSTQNEPFPNPPVETAREIKTRYAIYLDENEGKTEGIEGCSLQNSLRTVCSHAA